MTPTRHHNLFLDGAVCFWTSSVIERIPVFKSPTASRRMITILDECRTRCEVKLFGYVIMPDHIHLAVWAEHSESIKRFLRQLLSMASADIAAMTQRAAFKGNTTALAWLNTFKARARGGSAARVWKERGRAFPLTRPDALMQKLAYIHLNPVRKGLVARAEDWEFSSAAWYESGKGLLRIDTLDL